MKIKKILRNKGTDVETVFPKTSVLEAVQLLTARSIGLVVVCDEERRIAGVFSERDLVRAVGQHGAGALEMAVELVMTSDVQVCGPNDDIQDTMGTMTKGRFRHMPVLDGGNLSGIVSSTDILRYLTEHATSDERALFWAKIVWV